MCSCTQKAVRAAGAEEAIWGFVSRLFKDPERIRLGMERLIDEERVAANRGDPESTAKAWADKAAECVRLRAAYQDQQAAGLMTLEELGSKLSELDEMRRHAERELSALQDHQERVEQLEADRDVLLEEIAETVPVGLDTLTGEERNKVYRMLRLEVTPTPEGYSITGALRVRMQNGTDALIACANGLRTTIDSSFCESRWEVDSRDLVEILRACHQERADTPQPPNFGEFYLHVLG